MVPEAGAQTHTLAMVLLLRKIASVVEDEMMVALRYRSTNAAAIA